MGTRLGYLAFSCVWFSFAEPGRENTQGWKACAGMAGGRGRGAVLCAHIGCSCPPEELQAGQAAKEPRSEPIRRNPTPFPEGLQRARGGGEGQEAGR